MSYPTRGEVKERFLQRLNDPALPGQTAGQVYTEPVFTQAFNEAYDVLYNAFLDAQTPRIELMTSAVIPIGVTEITPADIGIESFGDFIFMRERTWGTDNKFQYMVPVDVLSQRQATDRLIEYNWRNNTFYFIGATQVIEIEVKYDSSGQAPTDDDTQIGVDACLNFMANYAVGVAGPQKGDDEIADRCMVLAVGRKFTEGQIGGYLFSLISNLVRSRQKVQVAPKPYTAWDRWRYRRAVPYVAAQNGSTGGTPQGVSIQVSTATGSIIGAIDGVNDTFVINLSVQSIEGVYRNGLLQTAMVDYLVTGVNQIQFTPGNIPQPGAIPDIVSAEVWPASN